MPCIVPGTREALGSIDFTYCAESVLSPKMVEGLKPLCQARANRPDAEATKLGEITIANCYTSGIECKRPGVTQAIYSCRYICPAEDKMVRKYSACASNINEAWSFSIQICKDATSPSFQAEDERCYSDGHPCD